MNLYAVCGFILAVLSFLGGLIWYSNRAGRNSARVDTSQRETANANAATRASQSMLAARTNGIRSENHLLDTLEKGTF